MRTTLLVFFLFSLCGYAGPGRAGEKGMFLTEAKEGYYLEAVRRAFVRRRWDVIEAGDTFVTGHISHRGVTATLTIYQEGENLIYLCEKCTRTKTTHGGTMHEKTQDREFVPTRWINNLMRDTVSFADGVQTAVPIDKAQPTTEESPTIKERLSQLKELLDSGAITQEEYQAARKEIISEI